MTKLSEEFTPDAFYLKFYPIRNEKGEWDGDIDISALIHDDHGLSYEGLNDMLHILYMVSASVPLFEEDEGAREKARAIVESAMAAPNGGYLLGDGKPETNKQTTTEGNVVTLKFRND